MAREACAECNRTCALADHRGRALCYTCWHAARESEPCYWLQRRDREDVELFLGGSPPSRYTYEEAVARAAEFENSETDPRLYKVVAGDWCRSQRVAHPGYLDVCRKHIAAQGRRSLE